MNRIVFALITLSFFISTSCGDDDFQNQNSGPTGINFELLEGEWDLENIIEGSGAVLAPPAPVNLILAQSAENPMAFSYNGTSTCNLYSGNVNFSANNRVSLGSFLTTEMACGEADLNTFEETYYRFLGQSVEFQLGQDSFALLTPDGETLNFIRAN